MVANGLHLGSIYHLHLGRLHQAQGRLEVSLKKISDAHGELAKLLAESDLAGSAEILSEFAEAALALADAVRSSTT
jgi:hypothetical protein